MNDGQDLRFISPVFCLYTEFAITSWGMLYVVQNDRDSSGRDTLIYLNNQLSRVLSPWQTFDVNDIFGTLAGAIIASIINIGIVVKDSFSKGKQPPVPTVVGTVPRGGTKE